MCIPCSLFLICYICKKYISVIYIFSIKLHIFCFCMPPSSVIFSLNFFSLTKHFAKYTFVCTVRIRFPPKNKKSSPFRRKGCL